MLLLTEINLLSFSVCLISPEFRNSDYFFSLHHNYLHRLNKLFPLSIVHKWNYELYIQGFDWNVTFENDGHRIRCDLTFIGPKVNFMELMPAKPS